MLSLQNHRLVSRHGYSLINVIIHNTIENAFSWYTTWKEKLKPTCTKTRGIVQGQYRQLNEEHMKSQEGLRDAIARYILLKLEDLMVVSHDLETHRR